MYVVGLHGLGIIFWYMSLIQNFSFLVTFIADEDDGDDESSRERVSNDPNSFCILFSDKVFAYIHHLPDNHHHRVIFIENCCFLFIQCIMCIHQIILVN